MVFGVFLGESWNKQEKSYYGSGESFVYKLRPDLQVYHWTEKNRFIVENFPNDHLGIGGGNGVAIYLDSDFEHGRSSYCETFNNDSLSSTEEFECVLFECWGFSKYVQTE